MLSYGLRPEQTMDRLLFEIPPDKLPHKTDDEENFRVARHLLLLRLPRALDRPKHLHVWQQSNQSR